MWREFNKTLQVAIPIIISNIAQSSLLLIDSAMIGKVDYMQLAASSLVINIIAIPQVLGMGITVAMSPLVAIANGGKNVSSASEILFNGFILTGFTSILLAVLLVFNTGLLYRLGQDKNVVDLAIDFYILIAWSLIPSLLFMALKQFTDALQFTKTGMLLTLISLPLNAFLNWVFIYGNLGMPRLELAGAGLATLITRVMIAVILLIVLLRHPLFKPYIAIWRKSWKVRFSVCKDLLKIGIPSSLQYGMESAAFSVSGIMIGWLGAAAQAAHPIALNLASATFMAALGLSLGGSIRVANAYGRGDRLQLRTIGISTITGGLIYGIASALFFLALKNQLPFLFTDNNQVTTMASSLLVFAAMFQISDSSQAIGVGLLRGIKEVKLPTAYVGVAYWIIGIPTGYFLAFRMNMGAAGIWIGFVTGLTVSAVLLNVEFLKKTRI